MNLLQGAFATSAGVVGTFLGALFFLQEKLIYHPSLPTRVYPETPADYSLPYTDVTLQTSDNVSLHAWLIPQPGGASATAATFIYFHGNAGTIAHRLMDVAAFARSGFNVLIVSYRGYGLSEGSPGEAGFKRDAAAAIEYAADRGDVLDTSQLFLFGRSIGGAVALAAAAKAEPGRLAGVVVENTFSSMGDMIDVVLPPLRFVKSLNRSPWDSLSIIGRIETPILFISGLRDELVPPPQVKRLHDAAVRCRIRHFHAVENGTHNDTFLRGGGQYRQAIRSFVDTVVSSAPPASPAPFAGFEGRTEEGREDGVSESSEASGLSTHDLEVDYDDDVHKEL